MAAALVVGGSAAAAALVALVMVAAAAAAAAAAAVVVRALWWDLHDEEFVAGTATPTTSGPDFAYLRDHLQQGFVYDAALRHFGLSPADIAERAEKYERVHQERAQRRLAQAAADSSSAQSAPQAEASGSGSSVLDRRGQLHELLVANEWSGPSLKLSFAVQVLATWNT